MAAEDEPDTNAKVDDPSKEAEAGASSGSGGEARDKEGNKRGHESEADKKKEGKSKSTMYRGEVFWAAKVIRQFVILCYEFSTIILIGLLGI